jgi:hypothetical protein
LRQEEVELLDMIGKGLGKNRSETVQHLLKQVDDWVRIFERKNPELIKLWVKENLVKTIIDSDKKRRNGT